MGLSSMQIRAEARKRRFGLNKARIQLPIILDHCGGGHAFAENRGAGLAAEFSNESGIGEETIKSRAQGFDIARRHKQAIDFVLDEFWYASGAGAQANAAVKQRFLERQTESFLQRR